jgi:hypothetical protein
MKFTIRIFTGTKLEYYEVKKFDSRTEAVTYAKSLLKPGQTYTVV